MSKLINEKFQNCLYTGDNLYILNGLNSNSVDLIYLDPPFNSKRTYSAPIGSKSAGASFKDMWTWQDVDNYYLEGMVEKYPSLVRFIESIQLTHGKPMMAYITYMTQRIIELHRILKSTGSFYIHIDPIASHYLKIVLDNIFGKDNFGNEIIWHYRTGGVSKKWFAKKHDVILRYVKNYKAKYIFNVLENKQYYDKKPSFLDKKGGKDVKGYFNIVNQDDVFEIKAVFNQSHEYQGYPTQKPLALLERIIKASSNEGDIVLDPFCGCATTCVASQQLKRKWLGIDIEAKAVEVLIDRLEFHAGKIMNDKSTIVDDFIHIDCSEGKNIPVRTDIKEIELTKDIKEKLYQNQDKLCNGCKKEFDIFNLEIDHIIPRAKGGGDYYENYQLLCSNCNKVKGDRPMEYLRMRIEKRNELIKNKLSFGE